MPAGGLYSTAIDVSQFCRMLLNGGLYKEKQFVTPASLKMMTADQTGPVMVSPDEAYGVGFALKKKKIEDGLSAGSFGHRGARKTVMWVDPDNQIVLIMLLQNGDFTGHQQNDLNTAFFKNAIDKYGRAKPTPKP